METGQGARTYLGFQKDADVEEFIAEARRSEKDGQPVDYQKYVYSIESKPGTQVMIPAGTIHASGQNQLILEIGSLTVGSYTYKMYDYVRKDLDGNPRPIHTYHGDQVLDRSRTADWVDQNLVNGGRRTLRTVSYTHLDVYKRQAHAIGYLHKPLLTIFWPISKSSSHVLGGSL